MEKCDFNCSRCEKLISIPPDPDNYDLKEHCSREDLHQEIDVKK